MQKIDTEVVGVVITDDGYTPKKDDPDKEEDLLPELPRLHTNQDVEDVPLSGYPELPGVENF